MRTPEKGWYYVITRYIKFCYFILVCFYYIKAVVIMQIDLHNKKFFYYAIMFYLKLV